jgi:AcrR family transcriptional regulator
LTSRGERTRNRILANAFQLIGRERGLHTRIEEICVAASVSRGTFYNYFSSTEELYATLAVELSHDFNMALLSTLERIESCAVRSNAAIQHYLRRARRDNAWGWAMVHLSATGPHFGAESYDACYRTIELGIRSGEFDLPNPQYGRELLMGTVLANMVATLRDGNARTQPPLVALYILRALGVPDRKAREIVKSRLPEIVLPR